MFNIYAISLFLFIIFLFIVITVHQIDCQVESPPISDVFAYTRKYSCMLVIIIMVESQIPAGRN